MPYTISDIPQTLTDAGSEYDWSAWDVGTEIDLYSVPWDNSYKDVVYFGDSPAKYKNIDSYLSTLSAFHVTTNAYIDINKPVRLDIGIGYAQFKNYIRVKSPAQPGINDIPRTFYYFITDVRRIAPDTTEFILQLDVWNTYRQWVTFSNAYVERGHILMAENHRFDDNGRTFLTVPEGLNLGTEYVTRMGYEYNFAGLGMDIIVVSTIDLSKPFGTIDAPTLSMAGGTKSQWLYNGVAVYAMQDGVWRALAMNIAKYPWIAQGITAIQGVPHNLIDYSKLKKVQLAEGLGVVWTLDGSDTGKGINSSISIPMSPNWRANMRNVLKNTSQVVGRDYSRFDKLMTSPYCQIELTPYMGSPLILNPEAWNDPNATVTQLTQVTPPGSRVIWTPQNYNNQFANSAGSHPDPVWSDWLNQQTGIYNWPTFMMANDGARLAYANQARTIAWEYNSADWSQQKALAGNQLGYDQASNSIAMMGEQNNVAVNARNQSNAIGVSLANQRNAIGNTSAIGHTALNGIGGIIGGAASGGEAGAVSGLMSGLMGAGNTAINVLANNASTAAGNAASIAQTNVSNSASIASTNISQAGASYVRDTNRQYADYSTRGDYANTIAGINARVQQLKMVPPSVVGQQGGETFNRAVWNWSLTFKVKTITNGALRVLCDIWARYGYATDRYIIDLGGRMSVMSKFTYWKCSEVYATPQQWCPFNYVNTLRGIFEKGVTVWNNPADIGVCDIYSNTPIYGDYIV